MADPRAEVKANPADKDIKTWYQLFLKGAELNASLSPIFSQMKKSQSENPISLYQIFNQTIQERKTPQVIRIFDPLLVKTDVKKSGVIRTDSLFPTALNTLFSNKYTSKVEAIFDLIEPGDLILKDEGKADEKTYVYSENAKKEKKDEKISNIQNEMINDFMKDLEEQGFFKEMGKDADAAKNDPIFMSYLAGAIIFKTVSLVSLTQQQKISEKRDTLLRIEDKFSKEIGNLNDSLEKEKVKFKNAGLFKRKDKAAAQDQINKLTIQIAALESKKALVTHELEKERKITDPLISINAKKSEPFKKIVLRQYQVNTSSRVVAQPEATPVAAATQKAPPVTASPAQANKASANATLKTSTGFIDSAKRHIDTAKGVVGASKTIVGIRASVTAKKTVDGAKELLGSTKNVIRTLKQQAQEHVYRGTASRKESPTVKKEPSWTVKHPPEVKVSSAKTTPNETPNPKEETPKMETTPTRRMGK